MSARLLPRVLGLTLLLSCDAFKSSEGESADCHPGHEKCKCASDDTCLEGLTCASDICVRVPEPSAPGGEPASGTKQDGEDAADSKEESADDVLTTTKEGSADDVVTKTEEFVDKVCACTDMSCAQKHTKAMAEWAEANKDAQGTERQAKQIEKHTQRLTECMTKLASGD